MAGDPFPGQFKGRIYPQFLKANTEQRIIREHYAFVPGGGQGPYYAAFYFVWSMDRSISSMDEHMRVMRQAIAAMSRDVHSLTGQVSEIRKRRASPWTLMA